MFRRRIDISIFLLCGNEVIRGDFVRGRNQPVGIRRQTVDIESNVIQALHTINEPDARVGQQCLVMSDAIWSQIILLPAISINGVEPDELQEALKFEAETLSGIESEDMALGHASLGSFDDQRAFWVSATRMSEVASATQFLESRGAREVRFFHPAGWAEKSGTESSVEFWNHVAFLFSESSELIQVKPLDSFVSAYLNGDSSNELKSIPEFLKGPGFSAEVLGAIEQIADLSQPEQLSAWLAGVSRKSLQKAASRVPAISIQSRQPSVPWQLVGTLGLAAAALAFCFLHHARAESENVRISQTIHQLKKPAELKRKYDAELLAISEQKTAIESSFRKVDIERQQVEFFFGNQKRRFSELLQILVTERTDDLVVQAIGGNEQGVTISGFSLTAESAQGFAKKLRATTSALGWSVSAADQVGQQKLTNGGPWDFEIVLTDVGVHERPAQGAIAQSDESEARKF